MIGKNIGEGTFGKVKAGIHNVTGEKVSDYDIEVVHWPGIHIELGKKWCIKVFTYYPAIHWCKFKISGRPDSNHVH